MDSGSTLNRSEICRLCTSTVNLTRMDEITVHKVQKTLKITVRISVQAPRSICLVCLVQLNEMYDFIKICEQSQNDLVKLLEEQEAQENAGGGEDAKDDEGEKSQPEVPSGSQLEEGESESLLGSHLEGQLGSEPEGQSGSQPEKIVE